MKTYCRAVMAAGILCIPLLINNIAKAHDFVGIRFFPATITTDDPFAVDELSLGGSYFKNPASDGEPGAREIDGSFEFDKEIFPRFAIGVSDTYSYEKARGEPSSSGWDNLGVSVKYEVARNDEHEAVFSIGMDTDIGGTGSKGIGDSFTTFTPTVYFGKGFGDLPNTMNPLKPFAVTGTVGQTLPTSASIPNALQWGLAVEYSLPYLQQHVADIGLPNPLKNMIPLVEFAMSTSENRGPSTTTGTINPGVLWETKQFQLGVEALIPMNRDSGSHVGVILNLQIYIDDMFPKTFGHPVFGRS